MAEPGNSQDGQGIKLFEKYLAVWVLLCMAAGLLIEKLIPRIPDVLGRFEYARISILIAILIWVIICPMMMKIDLRSVINVGRNPV